MKNYLRLITLATLVTSVAYAQQGEERNFGDLLPEQHFKINHSKTTLLDNADIKNYQISTSPKKDEFIYKVDTVKSPRTGIFGKKKDFKLNVERSEGKVTRFSSVSYTDNKENGGATALQSTSVLPSGYVDSHTSCHENYKLTMWGTKKAKSGYKCVTVSAAVCEYLAKNEIDSEMVEKINSCADVLGKLSKHQEHLFKLSKSQHKDDIAALKKVNDGKPSDTKNFYEMEGKTLADVSEIVSGYGSALAQCDFLKEKNYLAPKQEPTEETQESSGSTSREE
jgi:hypothetical protein